MKILMKNLIEYRENIIIKMYYLQNKMSDF